MYMNLRCPNCGFSFGADIPDDETEGNIIEIKTCPCGTMMVETDILYAMFEETEAVEGG